MRLYHGLIGRIQQSEFLTTLTAGLLLALGSALFLTAVLLLAGGR